MNLKKNLALILLVPFSITTVWLRLECVNKSYEVSQMNRMILNSKLAYEKSQLKLSALRSPRRLELLSRMKFKLSQPSPAQVVYLK